MTDDDLADRIAGLLRFCADHVQSIPPERRVQAISVVERLRDLITHTQKEAHR